MIIKLNDITNSVAFLSEKYDNLIYEHEQSKDKFNTLENDIQIMENQNKQKDEIIKILQEKLRQLEQYSKNKNILIQ